jgi:hypothetical protein
MDDLNKLKGNLKEFLCFQTHIKFEIQVPDPKDQVCGEHEIYKCDNSSSCCDTRIWHTIIVTDINKIDETFDKILDNKNLFAFSIPNLLVKVGIDTYAVMDIYQYNGEDEPHFGWIWINDNYDERGYRQFFLEL